MKQTPLIAVKNPALQQKSSKVRTLFYIITIVLAFFLLAMLKTAFSDRDTPSANAIHNDRSFRGSIISEDGYALSYSEKTYKAVIRAESIDPDKRELFITLFSIYSNIPKEIIREKMTDKNGKLKTGNIVLSRILHTTVATQLKALAFKLKRKNVFRWIQNSRGEDVLLGLDIVENGESRHFPLNDVMSPILGYTKDTLQNGYFRPKGIKGIESHYEEYITSQKNGYFRGKRDVVGTIIHDKNSIKVDRIDGMDLHLNISLALQNRIEVMLDAMKTRLEAQEILVGVMRSNTGQLLALATSNRFSPNFIRPEDIPMLNPKFSEYPYEAGSVLKPISMAIAIDNNVVTPQTRINTQNGHLYIGRHHITDDDKFSSLSATDVIVHSSNVGISKITMSLTGRQFYDGLRKFGISKPSGIDLSREIPGQIKSPTQFNAIINRCNSSYGYGMMINFAQLLKAYSAFNNNGKAMTPRIADYLETKEGKQYVLEPASPDLQAISPKTANQMHDILREVVERGTGRFAKYPGLEIGGKTGTAHIVENGQYRRSFHSSFYGFANDAKGHKYTIGIFVIKPTTKRKLYFAAQSAVPTFKNVIQIMTNTDYLKPDENLSAEIKINHDIYTKVETEPKMTTNQTTTSVSQKGEPIKPHEGLHKTTPKRANKRESLPAPPTLINQQKTVQRDAGNLF